MTTDSVVVAFFGLLGLGLWMVPTIIAFVRKHPKRVEILLVDIFLSWTVFGWIFATGWALRWWEHSVEEEPPKALKAKAS